MICHISILKGVTLLDSGLYRVPLTYTRTGGGPSAECGNFLRQVAVPRRLFFAAQQRIAITLSPNYYQKIQRFTTRKNQEEHGPDVMFSTW